MHILNQLSALGSDGGRITLSMNTDLIFERWECVRKLAWSKQEEKISKALFWANQSLFPGVSKLPVRPGGHSSSFTQESFYSPTQPGGFSKSSGKTVPPAGWISRKGCMAPSPSLEISPPLLSTQVALLHTHMHNTHFSFLTLPPLWSHWETMNIRCV